jgi:xanthine dehydrogenase accessory factor
MKNIYLLITKEDILKTGIVLATVTRTKGSTPQKPGSSAIFSSKGLVSGTVGGGVVEGRVQEKALEALDSKKSGQYTFNLCNAISNTEEAICGGEISVLLDASPGNSIQVFRQIRKSLQDRIPGVLITMVNDSEDSSVVITRYWLSSSSVPSIPRDYIESITPLAEELISSGNSYDYREMTLPQNDKPSTVFFLEPVFPPEHLVIAGAGHIGRALAQLGSFIGFEVTVIDDRSEYANNDNIPEADHIIVKDIGLALNELKKGDDTYVVIVTRGHKDDASALKSCIGSGMAYTGMIGSRKKVAAMRENFIEKGFATSEQWDKIHTPIGLDIGSQTVEEIAVSIAAQLIRVKNKRLKADGGLRKV